MLTYWDVYINRKYLTSWHHLINSLLVNGNNWHGTMTISKWLFFFQSLNLELDGVFRVLQITKTWLTQKLFLSWKGQCTTVRPNEINTVFHISNKKNGPERFLWFIKKTFIMIFIVSEEILILGKTIQSSHPPPTQKKLISPFLNGVGRGNKIFIFSLPKVTLS